MNKFLIVTHNDADGSTAAAVIAKKLKSMGVSINEIEVVVDNLSTKIDWDKLKATTAIFITDHPYVPQLQKNNPDVDVVWLDHHISSFSEDSKDIQGIRSASMAGCELAWLYCFGTEEDINTVKKYPKTKRQNADIDKIRRKAPLFVQYVGDNDNWDKRTKEKGWNVFVGANGYPDLSSKLKNVFPSGLLDGWMRMVDYGAENLDKISKYGLAIQLSLRVNQEQDCRNGLVEVRLKDFPGAKACILNSTAHGSGTFSSVKGYDIGCVFHYNSEMRILVSLYNLTGDEDKIDVGHIAKKHGGGGHKGAAGCTIDKLEEMFDFIQEEF